MTRDEFDAYCARLKATTHVIQWEGASVWKVGGKMFAICSSWGPADKRLKGDAGFERISFKCSELANNILCELDGIVPAPYLARAGWVQVRQSGALTDADLKTYLAEAHDLVAGKLTRKLRHELGLGA